MKRWSVSISKNGFNYNNLDFLSRCYSLLEDFRDWIRSVHVRPFFFYDFFGSVTLEMDPSLYSGVVVL